VVVNSDSDSESQEHFPDFDEYDDLFDKDISESEHNILIKTDLTLHKFSEGIQIFGKML
jgi:zinc transporter ZupT